MEGVGRVGVLEGEGGAEGSEPGLCDELDFHGREYGLGGGERGKKVYIPRMGGRIGLVLELGLKEG